MNNKRLLSIVLAMCLMVSMVLSVSAAEATVSTSGGTGTTVVSLTTEAATFSVTVPTSLVISVNSSGVVTCAEGAKITNESAGSVEVKGVAIQGVNDWVSQDYATMDPATMKVDLKSFAFEINECKTTGANTLAFDKTKFAVMTKKGDTNSSIDITYNAKVAPQSTAVDSQVANVIFTIGWYTGA